MNRDFIRCIDLNFDPIAFDCEYRYLNVITNAEGLTSFSAQICMILSPCCEYRTVIRNTPQKPAQVFDSVNARSCSIAVIEIFEATYKGYVTNSALLAGRNHRCVRHQ